MTPTERYYRRWIKEIAKRVTPGEIEKHIVYHSHDLRDPSRNLPQSWLASMYNLLAIYEAVHDTSVSTADRVYKLGNKYFKYKGWTPPPGGKIPENVALRHLKLGRVPRPGEKPVTVKMLRGIGRGALPRWSQIDERNKRKSLQRAERIFKHSRKTPPSF